MSEDDLNYPPERSRIGLYVVSGALALLLGANLFTFWRFNQFKGEMAEWRAAVSGEFAELRHTSSASARQSYERMDAMRQELAMARSQAAKAAGQARIEAQRHAERLAADLAAEQERQLERQQQVATELVTVKEAASTANTKIGEVSDEVASARNELQTTIADLKRMTGDMGVMSGLIATNGQELAALKALGERNYFEFDLRKTDKPQRVGDISVRLRKVDVKRNKYTVEIIADDKKVEKKDKNTNEPVQFYAAKSRLPYEFVVNEVRKDQIVGYLSSPKMQMARR
jgi:DNA repair ATPase RecN